MLFGRDRRTIRTILIVEDEPLVAFDNEHFLSHAGYRIAGTVNNFAHAAPILDGGTVDLVVTDVSLSGDKDGVDVAQKAFDAGIPVLFVTGSCPPQSRHLAYGCLAKPYGEKELLGAIQMVDAVLRGAKLPRKPRGFTFYGNREREA